MGDIFFMPLSGSQSVGASCYFLKIGNSAVILDSGIRIKNELVSAPDFYSLKISPLIQSLGQINRIFVSHAHADHSGYLLQLMRDAPLANVYMTEATYLLTKFQLYDRSFLSGRIRSENRRLAAQNILDKVIRISYNKPLDFGEYKVNFFPAGHMPGAMMTLFEYENKKILYTGDFTTYDTLLTDQCRIPEDIDIDTAIICALHAKHPWYSSNKNNIYKLIDHIYRRVECGVHVKCHVSQLSKGIEFITALNSRNKNNVPIYIDKSIMQIIEKMERLSLKILTSCNHAAVDNVTIKPHIYVTTDKTVKKGDFYDNIRVEFSLHDDFAGLKNFIVNLHPKKAFLVHCDSERRYNCICDDEAMKKAFEEDENIDTDIILAHDKEIYKL